MSMRARLAAWSERAPAAVASSPALGFVSESCAVPLGSHGVAVGCGHALRRALDQLCPPPPGSPPRLPLFFDLETTGLSVDSPPFLVGLLGFADDGTPWLRQLRLDARAGEGGLWRELHALLHRLAPHARLVTYNGASFDRTLARVRLRRLGLYDAGLAALFDAQHVDLLPVCRRLWRQTFPDHRLITLERHVLGAVRHGDPHGSEIAELGVAWLAGARDPGSIGAMRAVVRHNADDLCGLAALLGACARLLQAPAALAEAIGAARQLQRTDRREEALGLLRGWVEREPARATQPATIDAAAMLAALERRVGDRDRSHAAWQSVQLAMPGHPLAALALAKDFEHRLRSPARALAVLETMVVPCPRRSARLRAKLVVGSAVGSGVETGLGLADAPRGREPPRASGDPTGEAIAASPAGAAAMPGTWRAAAKRAAALLHEPSQWRAPALRRPV